jgi:hypothetical protein
MAHRILKICIRENCHVKILRRQRLEQEARQRELALLHGDQGLREQRQILQL